MTSVPKHNHNFTTQDFRLIKINTGGHKQVHIARGVSRSVTENLKNQQSAPPRPHAPTSCAVEALICPYMGGASHAVQSILMIVKLE
jgi:hypothetical protein